MEDDLSKTGLPPLGVEDIEKMKDLWKFSIRRSAAQTWAFRDIRFLVYDDTDDEMKGGAIQTSDGQSYHGSDDEEATSNWSLELSMESKSPFVWLSPQHTNAEPSDPDHSLPNAPDSTSSCDICCNVTEFPHDRKTRNFRLISPASLYPKRNLARLPLCRHYVAVSYCWPEPILDDKGQLVKAPVKSKVRDLDGIIRDARALDDVLDRAVDFANSAGLRMIWIDQECLPQPVDQSPEEEKEYQQLGVQAMDFVYSRAIFTVGLHSGSIVDQNQANALRALIKLDNLGSLDLEPHKYSSKLVNIQVDEFRGLLRVARRLLREQPQEFGITLHSAYGRSSDILERAELLHPSPTTSSNFPLQFVGGNQYGSRQSVNASTALTLLKSRHCRDTQDKIAIVANMCNYDVRLHTNSIARHCTSLRFAMLTLALINGDRSLLVPEVYSLSGPNETELAETWHAMKSLHVSVTPIKGESEAAFRSRDDAATRQFTNYDIMNKAMWEIFQHGDVPHDSTVWSGMDPTGINCTADLDVEDLEADPVAKRKLAGIIFFILASLHKLSFRNSQAAGVANSIWQSLRVDYTKTGSSELPDTVCDELFTHKDVLLDSSSTIQLHKGPGKSYLQLWFIDRIMQHGTLWVGRYEQVLSHLPSGDSSSLSDPESSSTREQDIDRELEENEENEENEEISDSLQSSASTASTEANSAAMPNILQRQRVRYMISRMADRAFMSDAEEATLSSEEAKSSPEEATSSAWLNIGSMAYFGEFASRDIWTAQADEARARDLVSVFDVDGPCTIATPFNAEWEVLPSPILRSMSSCWVVEKLDRDEHGRVPEQEPKVEDKDKGEINSTNEESEPNRDVDSTGDMPLYRVLHKVKGLWQLIDIPFGEVLFI
ncbi:hypothetical protein CcaCcLH18_01989 [Colletotrichum camelliae]|nr:hypothetical protein CcaCcLH18_01989 [Colletotrichum camelliae]